MPPRAMKKCVRFFPHALRIGLWIVGVMAILFVVLWFLSWRL